MRGVLERLRGRLRLRFAIPFVAVLACGVALLATFLVRGHGSDADDAEQTPAQVAAAQRFIDALPTLAGTQRDTSSTACDIAAPYCVWDAGRTTKQLTSDVRSLIEARGAHVDKVVCGEYEIVLGGCRVDATINDSHLVLVATDRSSDLVGARYAPSPSIPAHVAILIPDAEFPKNEPVTADYARSLFAAPLASELVCDPVGASPCTGFTATVSLPLPPTAVIAQLVPIARREGYLVTVDGCHAVGPDPTRDCMFAAHKFRGENGADGVNVHVTLLRAPDGSSRAYANLP
jgi:hypothetical protein